MFFLEESLYELFWKSCLEFFEEFSVELLQEFPEELLDEFSTQIQLKFLDEVSVELFRAELPVKLVQKWSILSETRRIIPNGISRKISRGTPEIPKRTHG